jgi:hypothetical protein
MKFKKSIHKLIKDANYAKMFDNMVKIAQYKGEDPKLRMAAVKAYELIAEWSVPSWAANKPVKIENTVQKDNQ